MKNQTLVFEVSKDEGVHYGEDWRVGTKCKKFWSAGAEEEPLGYWMSDEHNPDELWAKLDALAEQGYYIAFDIVGEYQYIYYPEWNEWWDSGAYVARKGDIVTGGDHLYDPDSVWIEDLSGMLNTDKPVRTYYSGYGDEGTKYTYEIEWDPSTNANDAQWNSLEEKAASEYQRFLKWIRGYGYGTTEDSMGSGVYDYMLRYADFDEEMTRKEITFLDRACYEYSFTMDGYEYNFIFDKETGIPLAGEYMEYWEDDEYSSYYIESWSASEFIIGYDITIPDYPEEEA
jgi:hypothetical protein